MPLDTTVRIRHMQAHELDDRLMIIVSITKEALSLSEWRLSYKPIEKGNVVYSAMVYTRANKAAGLVIKPDIYRGRPENFSSSHILIISAPSLIIGFLGFVSNGLVCRLIYDENKTISTWCRCRQQKQAVSHKVVGNWNRVSKADLGRHFEIVGIEFARRGRIDGKHMQVAMVEAQAISATNNIYNSLIEGCVRLKDRVG